MQHYARANAVFTVWWFASGEQIMHTTMQTCLADKIWNFYNAMERKQIQKIKWRLKNGR